MDKNIVSRFKYVRIQGQELAKNTMYARGIFSMCWDMVHNDLMEEEDALLFREIDDWFAHELPWPPQCKNQEKVICFFKTENSKEMLNMIQPAMWLLERYNHPFYLVYTNTLPGKIVYEDKYQVAVEVSGKLDVRPIQKLWSPED
ncbi:MAG: hypothetical protein K6E24_04480 [bacterium]|nr:hypothetical protein [bacterium]